MTVVVDYGRGNLFSLGQALRHLGATYEVTSDPTRVAVAKRIILPGVGAFGDAMQGLVERGLAKALKGAVEKGTPLLGICVGCQVLLTKGEEFGINDGLGVIAGTVARLPRPRAGDQAAIRIPNVGWRHLSVKKSAPVLGGVRAGDLMYFVHSYAPMVTDPAAVAATIHVNGADIPVAVHVRNVVGVQFHPEKSGPAGLELIRRFLETSFDE